MVQRTAAWVDEALGGPQRHYRFPKRHKSQIEDHEYRTALTRGRKRTKSPPLYRASASFQSGSSIVSHSEARHVLRSYWRRPRRCSEKIEEKH
ncbi:hypothetical protein cyc_04757 [Cyclospora cayetanensis]|uniref:Uncharacterized protein n=1 Tax=Cyclospora cayetanensis TaxID=88456 RepID=A0A1D3CY04_9EIME|nr:hypothetical protein cyc_04757 [Cyclospora cayetanensis]